MKHSNGLRRFLAASLIIAACIFFASGEQVDKTKTPPDLAGLWCAKLRFGPDLRGTLTIERQGDSWRAEIAGRAAAVKVENRQVSFELPDGQGAFRGRVESSGKASARGARIAGHWIQPRAVTSGLRYATPVILETLDADRWRGDVEPLVDGFTLFLSVQKNADGALGAWLGNPERNLGRSIAVERVDFDGRMVKLMGKPSPGAAAAVLAEGPYDAENDIFSIPIPWRGGTFDFHRATPADETVFYPRGKTSAAWDYRRPSLEDDGWPVGSLEEAGISREGIGRFVQMLIGTAMDSVHSPQIHGFLMARHGKLVVEEYFHGFHRDLLHDTRSAAKSLTSFLIGAAIQSGAPLSAGTSVYGTMDGPAALAGLEPRKRALTLADLLTMSSGLDIDDSDPASPGNEDKMQEQTAQPDWYRFTLDLNMVRNPGEKAVYGSANPDLAGGVLAKVTGRWLPDLFQELVAGPMQIKHYAFDLQPLGEAYMGGGVHIPPREFMKLGQVMVDGGKWHGRQVVSPEWVKTSTSPLTELRGFGYGYLWWITELPYRGRTVRAFNAGGNGGQVVMGIPELDLVIAFYGGNYADRVTYTPQRVYVPEWILPCVN